MKIVSACLAGFNCNYKGECKPCEKVIELVKKGKAIPVCPEQLGGLTTPREPAEIKNKKVLTISNHDATKEFLKGAEEVLRIAKEFNCTEAILKSKSPSCGFGKIYSGEFNGTLINGNGLTADLLAKNKIKIYSEEDFT